jgi:hypothetical protein
VHELVTAECERTLAALETLGAESVRATAMPLEEIAVHIMKGEGGDQNH